MSESTSGSIEARLAALEATVAELQRATASRLPTMQRTHRCPSCGGGTLLHFRHVQDLGHQRVVEMSLQKQFSTWWGLKLNAGVLEAFACRTCRLVEWHAVSLDDVQVDGQEVVEIQAGDETTSPDAGPYR